jgi:hypothetical protein
MMADSFINLAIAGTVLGVISTSMGIIVICIGPKAFKDYIIDYYNFMWWHPYFGVRRYEWLRDEVEKTSNSYGKLKSTDDIFRKVFQTWDPPISWVHYKELFV